MGFVKVRTKSAEITTEEGAQEGFDCAGVTLSIMLDKGEEFILNMWLIQEDEQYPRLRFDVVSNHGRRSKVDQGEINFELEEPSK